MEADSYQPILNISVMPWATKNLAPSIWHQLYLQTVRDHDALAYSGGGAGSHWSPLVTTLLASSLALISLKVQQYFFTLSRRSSYSSSSSSSSIRYLNQSEEELLYVMRQPQPTKKTKLRKSSKLRHARKKSLVEGGRTTSRRRRWKRLRITKETTTTNDRRKSFLFVVEMQHTENTKKPSSTLLPIDPRSSSILLPRMREEEGRCQSEPRFCVSPSTFIASFNRQPSMNERRIEE